MENQIQIFNNPAFGDIRTIVDENNTPWFVGKDVAEVLGYKDSVNALKTHVDPEDSMGWQITTPSRGRQNIKVINESGLYSLILSSKLPQAKEFKRWVTSDVLPTIRKHGTYMTDEAIQNALLNPDTVIQLATSLKKEREARLALQAKNQEQKNLIEEQKVQIADMTEKSIYCEMVLDSQSLVSVENIAQDYGTSAVALNKFLESLNIQWRRRKTDPITGKKKAVGPWNLYEQYKSKGYVQSNTIVIPLKNGTTQNKLNTKWTPSGVYFLYGLLKEHGVLPVVERGSDYVLPYELMSSSPKKKTKKEQT